MVLDKQKAELGEVTFTREDVEKISSETDELDLEPTLDLVSKDPFDFVIELDS